MLKHEGIPLRAVKEEPHTWNLRDLIEKRVDAIAAYSTVEPTQMRQAGVEPAMIRVADYGVDFYGDTLFTSEAVVKKDRARVAAFIRATRKGWEYAMEHQEELIDLIMKKPEVQKRGLQRENLEIEAREMRALILPDLVDIGHMNLGRWERMEQIYQETGLIRHKPSLNGFLFDPQPPADRRILWALGGVLAVALLGGRHGVALEFSIAAQGGEEHARCPPQRSEPHRPHRKHHGGDLVRGSRLPLHHLQFAFPAPGRGAHRAVAQPWACPSRRSCPAKNLPTASRSINARWPASVSPTK